MLGWAGNTIAGRLSTGEISPMVIVFLRWFLVSTLLFSIQPKKILRSLPKLENKIIWLILMGGLGWTGFNSLFYIAAQTTSAINLGIIQGVIPAVILLGTILLFKEKVSAIQIIGLVITFVGALIVVSKGNFTTLIFLTGNLGDLIMLTACFFYAGFTLGLKYKPALDSLIMMAFLAMTALLSSIPLVLLEYSISQSIWPSSLNSWLIIFYIALAPSFLSQILFMRGVELIGPAKAGLFINLIPIFSALLGILILNESLRLYHLISLAIVFTGIYLFMIVGDTKTKS
jgi:drug/metabolite transporter (DMT)-like permease